MIKFVKQGKRLSIPEVKYWRKVFNSNLMIGTEIEQMFSGYDVSVSDVKRMLEPLRIGGSPERFISPVSSVKSDGSLSNGAEIITPGRKVYGFMEQFSMFQSIYNCLSNEEPIISPRCGWHNHIVLQDYGANALERDSIPRVIFDNFMLLLKHYYPALAFMTSTVPDNDCYTRYDHFNLTESIKRYDDENPLHTIRRMFSERYNAVNINPMNFSDDKVKNFHVEFRFPDGTLFPAQMAALNILFKAIVLKAIELSKYGIVNFEQSTEDLYCFKNDGGVGDEDYDDDYDEDDEDEDRDNDYERSEPSDERYIETFRSSDRKSAMVNDEILGKIKLLSKELVGMLEPEIVSIDKLALPVLKVLSETPISIIFKNLATYDLREVNDYLEEIIDNSYVKADEQLMPLMEIIDLGMIKNTETKEVWFDRASELVSFKEPIELLINKIRDITDLNFDKKLGFYFK